MNYYIIIIISFIALIIYLISTRKKTQCLRYTNDVYKIQTEDLKDLPDWLNRYNEICITKTQTLTTSAMYKCDKVINTEYILSLNSFGDDDLDYGF
jgi:uncharacterized protein YoxC